MAKSNKTGGSKKSKRNRKFGRNKIKCENYRNRVGKPNGPGQPGKKVNKRY